MRVEREGVDSLAYTFSLEGLSSKGRTLFGGHLGQDSVKLSVNNQDNSRSDRASGTNNGSTTVEKATGGELASTDSMPLTPISNERYSVLGERSKNAGYNLEISKDTWTIKEVTFKNDRSLLAKYGARDLMVNSEKSRAYDLMWHANWYAKEMGLNIITESITGFLEGAALGLPLGLQGVALGGSIGMLKGMGKALYSPLLGCSGCHVLRSEIEDPRPGIQVFDGIMKDFKALRNKFK